MIEWRNVAGWDKYLVSNTGEVHRTDPNYRNHYKIEVLQRPTKTGYLQVWLGGTSGCNHYVHRLVAFAFIGPPPSDRHEIAHWDGNKTNNSVENLRWATKVENTADKRRQDAHPKLTASNVLDIKAMLPHKTRTEIAKEFNVTANMISRIALGRAWA